MDEKIIEAISDIIKSIAYMEVSDRITMDAVSSGIKGIVPSSKIICDEGNNIPEVIYQNWLICDVDNYRFTMKPGTKLLRPGLPLCEPIVEVERRVEG